MSIQYKLVPGAIEVSVNGFQVWLGFPYEVILPELCEWVTAGTEEL